MIYTITIEDSTQPAISLINLIKTLANDYSFIRVEETDTDSADLLLTQEQEMELDRRYAYVLQHPEEGKTWEEVERKLLSK
jgi:hypothetical protein